LKHFSFKIVVLCILLPPLMYLGTIRLAERYFQTRYTNELENTYLGDTRRLYDGSVRLGDAVSANVERFLRSKPLIGRGLTVKVTVVTGKGTILYPALFNQEEAAPVVMDPMAVAAENFDLLQNRIVLTLDASVRHLDLLPNLILLFYVTLAGLVLFLHYRAASKKYQQEDGLRRAEIQLLHQKEATVTGRLSDLDREKGTLTVELNRLKETLADEKSRASHNEDALIEEIESLEGEINKNIERQSDQQRQIDSLKKIIEQLEKSGRRSEKQRNKAALDVGRRFKTLYKKLVVAERALNGFVDLGDDIKIKAEEVIHQLNEDPDQVIIKRKVFIGKRDGKSVMEVIFGYKGRLYFRKNQAGVVEVLAIGDKNTQSRELTYLSNL
jgi:hypothetical protein